MSSALTATTSEPMTQGKQACSVGGCETESHVKGLCSRHYREERIQNAPKCSVEDCETGVHAKGLCSRHYIEERVQNAPKCSVEDCETGVRAKGLCSRHYREERVQNTPKCSVDGCENGTTSDSLCGSHYAKKRRLIAGCCSIEECNNKVNARGLCITHYTRLRRHGDPMHGGEIRSIGGNRKCQISGCGGDHYGKGWCNTHYHRWYNGRDLSTEVTRRVRDTSSIPSGGLDAEWAAWFSGITDGDGHLGISVRGSALYSLSLRKDDEYVLREIHRTLGVGGVYIQSRDHDRSMGSRSQDAAIYRVNGPSCSRVAEGLRLGLSGSFDSWFAGMMDAEGHFGIGKSGTMYVEMKLRSDDASTLRYVRDQLGVGSVYEFLPGGQRKNRVSVYKCGRRSDLQMIVRRLEGKMRSKKKEDFAVWAEAVAKSNALGPGNHPDRKPMMLEYKKKLEEIRDKGKWKGPVGDGGSEG